jgi:hypothetical protein
VRFLSKEDRDRLIVAYAPHIQPIITMLAFHGPRIQTALQLTWGVEGVDMKEGSIRLNHSKNGPWGKRYRRDLRWSRLLGQFGG